MDDYWNIVLIKLKMKFLHLVFGMLQMVLEIGHESMYSTGTSNPIKGGGRWVAPDPTSAGKDN